MPNAIKTKKLIEYLAQPHAGKHLVILATIALSIFYALKYIIVTSNNHKWQINGYYIATLEIAIFSTLTLLWFASIIILFTKSHIKRAIKRTLATIPILLCLAFFFGFILWASPGTCGIPVDTIFSKTRHQHYVLSKNFGHEECVFQILSSTNNLLNPIWKFEIKPQDLEYEGMQGETPRGKSHLILSEDEKIIVIARGEHLTDAILIDSKKRLIKKIAYKDFDRENQWQQRTDKINLLLKEHSLNN